MDIKNKLIRDGAVKPTDKLIATFDGGYNRTGFVVIRDAARCHACLQIKPCILMNGSEDEYNDGAICRECANKAFDSVEPE